MITISEKYEFVLENGKEMKSDGDRVTLLIPELLELNKNKALEASDITRLYSDSLFFSDGLSAVRKDDKYGYINTLGELVIPIQYDNAFAFSEGMAMVIKDGKRGYVDTLGEEVIPCIYDYGYSFSDGFALIIKDGKCGYINKLGEIVIECKYDWAQGFSDGLALVRVGTEPWYYIDKFGNKVFKVDLDTNVAKFSEGYAAIGSNGEWGFIDKECNLAIPQIYNTVRSFNEGLAWVCKNGKWGCINYKGEEVTEFIYDDANDFSEGLAWVMKNRKMGAIDKEGNVVIPFIFDLFPMADYRFVNGLTLVKHNNKKYFVDKTGKRVNIISQKRFEDNVKVIEALTNLSSESVAFAYDLDNQSVYSVKTWTRRLELTDEKFGKIVIEKDDIKDFQKELNLY